MKKISKKNIQYIKSLAKNLSKDQATNWDSILLQHQKQIQHLFTKVENQDAEENEITETANSLLTQLNSHIGIFKDLTIQNKKLSINFYDKKNFIDTTPYEAYCILSMINIVDRVYYLKAALGETTRPSNDIESIFNNYKIPLAIIKTDGEIVYHNQLFAKLKLLPKKCLALTNEESIEIGDRRYIVSVRNLDQVGLLHLFAFSTDKVSKIVNLSRLSAEELGIVSGSMAHELNNPLAGILAAIAVLDLENEIDNETKQLLLELATSARRCKELVEVFLGFSKQSKISGQIPTLSDFTSIINQAIGLLKFRMLDSNIIINFKEIDLIHNFKHEINKSILTISIYLILDEILTATSHSNLIRTENGPKLICRFEIDHDTISLINSSKIKHTLTKNRLLQYLLASISIDLKYDSDKIELVWK